MLPRGLDFRMNCLPHVLSASPTCSYSHACLIISSWLTIQDDAMLTSQTPCGSISVVTCVTKIWSTRVPKNNKFSYHVSPYTYPSTVITMNQMLTHVLFERSEKGVLAFELCLQFLYKILSVMASLFNVMLHSLLTQFHFHWPLLLYNFPMLSWL